MKTYITKFSVVGGRSSFPVDMLRYDHCFPSNASAVEGITESLIPGGAIPGTSIDLLHVGVDPKWQPTIARWESFGWQCSPGTR